MNIVVFPKIGHMSRPELGHLLQPSSELHARRAKLALESSAVHASRIYATPIKNHISKNILKLSI